MSEAFAATGFLEEPGPLAMLALPDFHGLPILAPRSRTHGSLGGRLPAPPPVRLAAGDRRRAPACLLRAGPCPRQRPSGRTRSRPPSRRAALALARGGGARRFGRGR